MEEASLSGTIRTILVLLVIWLVIRLLTRRRTGGRPGRTTAEQRPKGHVRIERPDDPGGPARGQGPVEDADFEEVR